MSLKDEIEKLIQAEQEKLKQKKQNYKQNSVSSDPYYEQKRERFKTMASLLTELCEPIEIGFMNSSISEYSASIRLVKVGGYPLSFNIFEENSKFVIEHRECFELMGLDSEEVINKVLTFDTEQEAIKYLMRKISNEIAQLREFGD
jgi:hypothetical protein